MSVTRYNANFGISLKSNRLVLSLLPLQAKTDFRSNQTYCIPSVYLDQIYSLSFLHTVRFSVILAKLPNSLFLEKRSVVFTVSISALLSQCSADIRNCKSTVMLFYHSFRMIKCSVSQVCILFETHSTSVVLF